MLTLVAGFVVLLLYGRGIWFADDDFDFLSLRGFHNAPLGLFVPHNEHWSTIPILLWRTVYLFTGLRHYGPYLALMIVAHLIAVHLLWRIARHLSVDPWVATALASSAVLLGVGEENLLWAFQVGFVGSVAFGFGAILLALRLSPGWSQGKALAGLWVLAVGALMCSGIGVSMVFGTTLVAWVARGSRPAILSASLPTLIYAGWYEMYGRVAVINDAYGLTSKNVDQLPAFVANGFTTSLGGWVDIPDAGATLLILVVLVVAVRRPRGIAGLPLALVCTALAFFTITATGRIGFGVNQAGSSRYCYIAMMLMFPTIMVGFDIVARRGGLLVTAGVSVLLLLSSATTLDSAASMRRTITQTDKQNVLASAVLLRDHQPLIGYVPLLNGVRIEIPELERMAADLPSLSSVTPATIENVRAALQISVAPGMVAGDQTPAIDNLNGAAVVGRVPSCVSLSPKVTNATVTLSVPAAISAFSLALGRADDLAGNIQQTGEAATGSFALPLSEGTNWLRVADAGSVLTLILPPNQVSTLCNVSDPL